MGGEAAGKRLGLSARGWGNETFGLCSKDEGVGAVLEVKDHVDDIEVEQVLRHMAPV